MSWSASVPPTERGRNFADAVDLATTSPADLDEPMAEQFNEAKRVVKELGMAIPGPKVSATMSGHANGVGDREKPGWSNDYVTITISQVTK